jgi:hypothetical protein
MGNVAAVFKAGGKDLATEINKVAFDYITTLNFQDMQNLMDTDTCNQYVLVTSEVLDEQLKTKEIADLYKSIQPLQTLTVPKGKVTLLRKKDNEALSTKLTPLTKTDMCKEVAKFYLTIAHVFAAIATSINPSFVYTDAHGNLKVANITNKPADTPVAVTQPNFCNKLINALQKKEDGQLPGYCSLNAPGATLAKEPGIPELEPLYFDVYDQKHGTKSAAMNEKYQKDLATFYTAFTGETDLPTEIDMFSKIPLQNYAKERKFCATSDNASKTLDESQMKKYGEHISMMMRNANTSYQQLLRLLERIFEVDQTDKVRVRDNLTQSELDDIVNDTRNTILNMYKQCHADFAEGMKLYEALIYEQYLETTIAAQETVATVPQVATATEQESPNSTGQLQEVVSAAL